MDDPAWLLGKPYALGARGPEAYDCWGVVLALGQGNPEWAPERASALGDGVLKGYLDRSDTLSVTSPEDGDVALLWRNRRPEHCGVWWDGRILHAMTGLGVTLTRPEVLLRMGFNRIETYRWLKSSTPAHRWPQETRPDSSSLTGR